MNIYIAIYICIAIVITLCELYITHVYVSKPDKFRTTHEMDPVTWTLGSLFLGIIWPITITMHIIAYFMTFNENGN